MSLKSVPKNCLSAVYFPAILGSFGIFLAIWRVWWQISKKAVTVTKKPLVTIFIKAFIPASVDTVLIFQFSPNLGTVASVPTVSRYRFQFLLLDTRVAQQGFQGIICIFLISVPFRFQIQAKPRALALEPKFDWNLKIADTKIQKSLFFWYFFTQHWYQPMILWLRIWQQKYIKNNISTVFSIRGFLLLDRTIDRVLTLEFGHTILRQWKWTSTTADSLRRQHKIQTKTLSCVAVVCTAIITPEG